MVDDGEEVMMVIVRGAEARFNESCKESRDKLEVVRVGTRESWADIKCGDSETGEI